MQRIIIAITILSWGFALHLDNNQHDFAAVEETYFVSRSQGLAEMYKCKDRCMALKTTFNKELKYLRTVWAQALSSHRYL